MNVITTHGSLMLLKTPMGLKLAIPSQLHTRRSAFTHVPRGYKLQVITPTFTKFLGHPSKHSSALSMDQEVGCFPQAPTFVDIYY